MPNAWPCIGPGATEREPEACSSCLAVVLHEPGLVEWFAGRRSFAPDPARPGVLHLACIGLDSASYPGWIHARFLANNMEAAWTSRTSAGVKACLTCFPPRSDEFPRYINMIARALSVESCG